MDGNLAGSTEEPPVLLYKIEQGCQQINVSRSTMFQLLASGEIQSVTIGRLRRIPAAALEAYVAKLVDRAA